MSVITHQSGPSPEVLYDVAQVAEHLHCGRTQVFALVKAGDLLSVKVGRRRLVPSSALAAYIDSLKPVA